MQRNTSNLTGVLLKLVYSEIMHPPSSTPIHPTYPHPPPKNLQILAQALTLPQRERSMPLVAMYVENLENGELMEAGKYRAYQLFIEEEGQPEWLSSEGAFDDDGTHKMTISTDVTHERVIQATHGYFTALRIHGFGPRTTKDVSEVHLEDPETGHVEQLGSAHSMEEIRYTHVRPQHLSPLQLHTLSPKGL